MKKKFLLFVVTALLLTTADLLANDNKIQVNIEADQAGHLTASGPNNQTIDVAGANAVITITCGAGVNCASISAVFAGEPLILESPTSQTKTVTIPAASIKKTVVNVVIRKGPTGADRLIGFKLQNTLAPATDGGGTSDSCAHIPVVAPYDPDENVARFVVTPGGSILRYPNGPIDENDTIEVTVFGADTVVDSIEVARTTQTRALAFSAVGAEVTTDFSKLSSEIQVCKPRVFTLGDFAPGEGAVEMYTIASGTKSTLGTFKFKVNKLYDGILSFGPIWTPQLADTTFKLAPSGQDKVIVPSEEKKRNIIYAVGYTYYAWGRRDLEKSYDWYMHVNPTIAFSVNNMKEHGLAGVTVDLGQILVTVGAHFAHVTQLSSASGLAPGSKFTGADADIPTSKRWEGHAFVGVTVDLRAAAALLKTLGK